MRDKIGDHEDRIDSIFYRLKRLEDEYWPPSETEWKNQVEEFKEEVKKRIIDLDFRINEVELQLEEIKQYNKPREEKS